MMRSFIIMIIGLSVCSPVEANEDSVEQRRQTLLTARTVQIDTSFAYYKNRSAESIVSEIELNGFEGVYHFVLDERTISHELIREFQRRGIPVAAMFFASGIYSPHDLLPEGWQRWKMKFTSNDLNEYPLLSYVHDDYLQWLKKRIVKVLMDFQYDGFTFAEIMYPIFDGPTKEKVLFGDVSQAFQNSFKEATGNKAFPDFVDANSSNYFRKNKKLYQDLVRYRIRTINDFYDEIVNGKGGIRENCPDIKVATWTLGVNLPGAVAKIAEWEGSDITSMIRAVKPDIHFVQTHYPDWTKSDLPADYCEFYRPFFNRARRANRNVKVGFQTDIGSLASMRRDPRWLEQFYRACRAEDINTTTYYEFSLRWEIYSNPPELKSAEIAGPDNLKLFFDQYLAEKNAELMQGREVEDEQKNIYKVIQASVDGNILVLKLDKSIGQARQVVVPLGGVCDDPAVRLPLSHVKPAPSGPVNAIAAGVKKAIKLQRKSSGTLKKISGSFVQLPLVENWTTSNWDTEFGYMKAVGMDHIILQWTVHSGVKNKAYYPSKLGYACTKENQVKNCLESARRNGFKVWLGLNWTEQWWPKGAYDLKWLEKEFELSKKIATELWQLYSHDHGDTIAGFYMTMEVHSHAFVEKILQQRMAAVYRKVCDHVHDLTGKPVMVAPFFLYIPGGLDASGFAKMWVDILKEAPVDVIALQDGVGCDRGSADTVGPWFAQLRQAIKSTRPQTQFWSDLETMEQISASPAKFTSASAERISRQIKAEAPFVDKITSFSFNHYQSPQQGHREQYERYRKMLKSLSAQEDRR